MELKEAWSPELDLEPGFKGGEPLETSSHGELIFESIEEEVNLSTLRPHSLSREVLCAPFFWLSCKELRAPYLGPATERVDETQTSGTTVF